MKCESCNGSGKYIGFSIEEDCKDCLGKGVIEKKFIDDRETQQEKIYLFNRWYDKEKVYSFKKWYDRFCELEDLF